ncbi:N-acetyltransferase [Rugamonas sp. CCM 8940]|uniref:N-acyl amino acid synthase FeeM domain-containing protein n=1 Tax=Rugamonas sp. CCM 8940 TaxID=2765359 RepID=UPI001F18AADB|nr:N-acetyltransferase [Rugamonas sp. CCM 8940]
MENRLNSLLALDWNAEQYGSAIIQDIKWLPGGEPVASAAASFGIHLADLDAARHSSSQLINRRYQWRGYGEQHRLESHPQRVTLAASGEGRLFGTVSLTIDSAAGIQADAVFKEEIDACRRDGARVCEVTKLAIDPVPHSKLALASLFHILFLYARKVHHCSDAFVEVNPRHRRYYQDMLGFEQVADSRYNPRVDATAYLLRVSLEHMERQIAALGGRGHEGGERSLYPYFFGPAEEAGITARLLALR